MFGNFLGGGGFGFDGGFSFGGGFGSNKESNRCKLCKESGSMFGHYFFSTSLFSTVNTKALILKTYCNICLILFMMHIVLLLYSE